MCLTVINIQAATAESQWHVIKCEI